MTELTTEFAHVHGQSMVGAAGGSRRRRASWCAIASLVSLASRAPRAGTSPTVSKFVVSGADVRVSERACIWTCVSQMQRAEGTCCLHAAFAHGQAPRGQAQATPSSLLGRCCWSACDWGLMKVGKGHCACAGAAARRRAGRRSSSRSSRSSSSRHQAGRGLGGRRSSRGLSTALWTMGCRTPSSLRRSCESVDGWVCDNRYIYTHTYVYINMLIHVRIYTYAQAYMYTSASVCVVTLCTCV